MLKVGDATERTLSSGAPGKRRGSGTALRRSFGVESMPAPPWCAAVSDPTYPAILWPPTLLADCTADMHAVREEAFGPVVVVLAHDDDDEGGGPGQRLELWAG
ncbi:MAG: hypothetical protein Ct9H300mP12_15730 [Acidimicrobiales bacterium]|nr:MAG: hypothetical protein Ct9H300mP12_15730 [Acidimicrobiales bacterium]